MKIGIFSLGQKGFSVVEALSKCLKDGHTVVVVVGKDHNVLSDYSLETITLCEKLGLRFEVGNTFNMQAENCDLVFAAGWRWMIRDIPQDILIVFHDSLLPRYRGFAPLVNSLLNRESEVGVTALYGGEKFDTGNIIAQQRMKIEYPTFIHHEIQRISKMYGELAAHVYNIMIMQNNRPSGVVQNEDHATYSLWRDDDDYRIDWSLDATEIAHFVSCVGYPYLGACSKVGAEKYRILEVVVVPDVKVENRSSGKVIFIESGMPIVVCGSGLLRIEKMVSEDGERVNWNKIRTRFT
ncbi:methionyl-tRNA formyltransferase [Bdellovibrio sp. KM01]|uniref:methionyl-tRNA formyltransferase n=1 Tax=Bdellovibrio sp. KM01 TaxID=2748865 RepID=UPI0015E90303|nr:formyltransferase family protein [Bdellovibrio sp. KM01]QLY27038.1 methionyl-tRNA formyltransferase [Bdellovibrio sp. KM01]